MISLGFGLLQVSWQFDFWFVRQRLNFLVQKRLIPNPPYHFSQSIELKKCQVHKVPLPGVWLHCQTTMLHMGCPSYILMLARNSCLAISLNEIRFTFNYPQSHQVICGSRVTRAKLLTGFRSKVNDQDLQGDQLAHMKWNYRSSLWPLGAITGIKTTVVLSSPAGWLYFCGRIYNQSYTFVLW